MRPAIFALPSKSAPATSLKPQEGFPLARCCAQSAARSSSSMFAVMASVPSPTRTPRRAISTTSGNAHGVVKVRLGVVHDRGAGLREARDLAPGDVDAMGCDRAPSKDAKPRQPADDPHLRGSARRLLVGLRLGGVDVEADLQGVPEAGRVLERPVRERERGVQPEERTKARPAVGLAPADEVHVLRQALLRDLRAVAVGDLVAEAGAKARLSHGAGNRVEGAGHGAGARVVVDERGGAVTDRVDSATSALW